jgi:hypothetical protein
MIDILITIIVLLILWKVFFKEKEKNNNIVLSIFLSKSELEKYLIKDYDNYYKNFNETDFKVRNIKSLDEYNEIIKKSCDNISDKEQEYLSKCINNANIKISNFKDTLKGFDGKKCSKLEWKIGLINDDNYEAGMPHTRNDIIILPKKLLSMSETKLISTLIHEKIHIYQKQYPNDIELYLKENGFKKHSHKSNFNNIRANPDLDEFVYTNKNGQLMRSIYNNNATNVNSVTIIPINSVEYEHPFEYMAYYIQNKVS